MKNELVSIIVPIYNTEKYLENCILSLINQTYENIEIILINDGSKDKSLEICLKYQKMDKRIIIINKENTGVSDSRNFGIRKAKGKYIVFIDSDDFIGKGSIENLVKYSNSDVLVSLGHYTVFNNEYKENKYKKNVYFGNEIISKILSSEVKGISCGYLFDSKNVKNILFDINTYYLEDMLFLVSYLKKYTPSRVMYLNCTKNVSYNYVYNLNSTTVSAKNILTKTKMIFYSLSKIDYTTNNLYTKFIENKKIILLESNMRSLTHKEDIKIFCDTFNVKSFEGKSIKYHLFSFMIRKKMIECLKLYFIIRRKVKKILKHKSD